MLLGLNQGPRSVLFLRERDAAQERWSGELLGLKRAKRRFDVDEVRNINDLENDLAGLIEHSAVIHYAPGSNERVDALVWKLLKCRSGPRLNFPQVLKDSRLITSAMRVVKDREEIRSLRHVNDLSARAMLSFAPLLKELKSERHAAKVLESLFAKLGAHGVAFPTIVASGRNAVTLHHEPKFQPLWKRELVLVDCGAVFNGYCADITRTLPVSGSFTDAQARVYDVVLNALSAGIEKAKPGSSMDAIHHAAVRSITSGLLSLGVLKGNVNELLEKNKHLPYFMHRSGHFLGLDVHDISPVYAGTALMPPRYRPLEPGNALTIEPGLYFDSKDETVPVQYRGIGIRIEESVLITSSGCDVLTARMPRSREELESLIAGQNVFALKPNNS